MQIQAHPVSDPRELETADQVLAEIAWLEREEEGLSTLRRALHVKMERGMHESLVMHERTVSEERHGIHRRLDDLHSQLATFLRIAP
jgi:hypothetical protein